MINRTRQTLRLAALALSLSIPLAYSAPVLFDIERAAGVDATVQDFIDAGVTEDITGATVIIGEGGNPSAGGITVSTVPSIGAVYDAAAFNNPTNSLLNDYTYMNNNGPTDVTISGLAAFLVPNQIYKLYLFGIGDSPNQNSVFTYGGESITTPPDAPPAIPDQRFASFLFQTGATVEDTLTFNWARAGNQYAGWNGFAIVESDGSVPPKVTHTPVNGATGVWMQPVVTGTVKDGTDVTIDAASVQLFQNGSLVATGATKVGDISSISYTNMSNLPAGSVNTSTLIYSDTLANSYTNDTSWTVSDYSTLPGAYALAAPATTPGFAINVYQTDYQVGAGNLGPAATPNITAAEQQLAGGLVSGFQSWDGPLANTATPGSGTATIINNTLLATDVGDGNFGSNTPPAGTYTNDYFVGIPEFASGGTLNFSYEVNAFLRLAAGNYRMIVASDDGFKATVAPGLNNPDGMLLGGFLTGTKGASDVAMDFVVTAAGDYPFRVLFYQASGNGGLEWIMQNMDTGEKVLINDPNNVNSVKAFRTGTSRATLTKMLPADGWVGENPNTVVQFALRNGTTSVGNPVTLKIDGKAVTPTVSLGATSTVLWTNTAGFNFGSTHTAELTWTENTVPATTWTNSTTFTILNVSPSTFPVGTFWFEFEDFDYGGGQYLPAVNDLSTYFGGAYQQTIGTNGEPYVPILNVDYYNNGNGGNDNTWGYRGWYPANRIPLETKTDPASMTRIAQVNAPYINQSVNVNWQPGWSSVGDWNNYTRVLTNGTYNAFAWFASNQGNPGSGLSLVRSGVGTTNQVLQNVGIFAPGASTGGWQSYQMVPMKDGNGALAAFQVSGPAGGTSTVTFRYDQQRPGYQGVNVDWMALVPTANVPPSIFSASPANGAVNVSPTNTLAFGVQAYDIPVNTGGITLDFNGAPVTPVVTGPDANGVLAITYDPGVLPGGSTNTYLLSVPDTGTTVTTKTSSGTFVVVEEPAPVFTGGTSITNGQITMTWTGTGTLQSNTNLTDGTWIDVDPAPVGNTYTAPADQPESYYRLKQ